MKLAINHTVVKVDEPADKTVLQFLREHGLTGTKEGCASGDCGACTVMVRSMRGGEVNSQAINACIAPVGQFEGCHLVTVEGLARGDELHPAQAQMVACHGSQCGFCTPGFVMSLATLVETGVRAGREAVLQGISGNLCRCTGYRPIVSAGLTALGQQPCIDDAAVYPALATDGDDAGRRLLAPDNEKSLQQALADHPGARLVAGGTDMMLEVTQRFEPIGQMIDVTRVAELNAYHETDDELVIGAAVPYTRLESLFADTSAPLHQLLLRLGSRQIRNRGTIGGNLANGSPIADMPPVLMAWDASIEIVDSTGARRQVAVPDFYLGYRDTVLAQGEYISCVRIPRRAMTAFHRFYKSSKRIEDDISSTMGALRLEGTPDRITAARIAYGGMAATPVQLAEVEQLLVGRTLDDELIEQASSLVASNLSPMTDVRASAAYRTAMAQAMLERALREFRGEHLPVITEVDPRA